MLDPAGFLRKERLEELTNISYSTIRRLMIRGEFPTPIQISPRAVGWRVADVRAWLEARPNAHAPSGTAPAPVASSRTSDEMSADDQERRVVALVNSPEGAGRTLLAQRLAAERSIPLTRAAEYLAKGPMDPSPEEQARRIAGAVKSGALVDPVDLYLDQCHVAERSISRERVRAIVEAPEASERPSFARYLAESTQLEPAACIAMLKRCPVEEPPDAVARRIAGVGPAALPKGSRK